MIQAQSFYEGIAASSGEEIFTTLFEKAGLKIERIASHGQASPEGFWYDQPQDEWVLLVRGQATLEIQDQPSLALQLGDHVGLPAHTRHRVTETSEDALWLAVHLRV
ncbi:MAG: cupin domain-containing protein [Verrucomicrobia bacterium]|nr:cupin domain-containing protein [Verrucomicrobiota bacterium]